MTTPLVPAEKTLLYDIAADIYLSALKKQEIQNNERQEIAKAILEMIKKAQTWDDILNFCKEKVEYHEFFKTLLLKLNDENSKNQEKQVIEKLRQHIGNLK